jgi:hypothetical protein
MPAALDRVKDLFLAANIPITSVTIGVDALTVTDKSRAGSRDRGPSGVRSTRPKV